MTFKVIGKEEGIILVHHYEGGPVVGGGVAGGCG